LELVREGISFEQITAQYYPELESEDIKACIQFAIDIVQAEEVHITAAT
jgi:uncharacterized protein (DUF433 family)